MELDTSLETLQVVRVVGVGVRSLAPIEYGILYLTDSWLGICVLYNRLQQKIHVVLIKHTIFKTPWSIRSVLS